MTTFTTTNGIEITLTDLLNTLPRYASAKTVFQSIEEAVFELGGDDEDLISVEETTEAAKFFSPMIEDGSDEDAEWVNPDYLYGVSRWD